MLSDVYFGDVTKELNWRDPEFEDLSPDDDEELVPTPSDVVDILGFDPRDEDIAKAGSGIMIAWFPPSELADKLAQDGGEKPEELHVTLAYLGKQEAFTDDQVELLKDTVEEYCSKYAPLQGTLGGNGRFPATPSSDDKDVLIKMVDVAMLEAFREELIEELAEKGISIVRNHGYTPHMTLAYVDPDYTGECTHPDTEDIVIDALTVAIGAERHVYPLNGEEVLKSNPCHVLSGPQGGQFCETKGGGAASGSAAKTSVATASGYEEFSKTVSGALDSIPQKFRVAPVDIEVKSLSDSTLLTRKLLGTYGATDLNAGKIELFPTSKYAPPLSSTKLSAVTVHEYGHAVDGHLGRTSGGNFASSDPKFIAALAKDYQSLKKSTIKKNYGYLGSDAKEVFAEAFSLHSSGSSFAKSAGFGENFASDFKNTMQHVGGLF